MKTPQDPAERANDCPSENLPRCCGICITWPAELWQKKSTKERMILNTCICTRRKYLDVASARIHSSSWIQHLSPFQHSSICWLHHHRHDRDRAPPSSCFILCSTQNNKRTQEFPHCKSIKPFCLQQNSPLSGIALNSGHV